jgi:hypothetical protein
MQKQVQQQANTQQQSSEPVEIDASLLSLISGGAPKSGWTEPQALALASTSAPKSGW